MTGKFLLYVCSRCGTSDSVWIGPHHERLVRRVSVKCRNCMDVLFNAQAETRRAPGDDRLTSELPTRFDMPAPAPRLVAMPGGLSDRVRELSARPILRRVK